MKRSLASLLVASFILWILPLGFFIKPSQEKLACDGQRAMCMCHVVIKANSSDKIMEPGIALKTASSTNKENASGGSNYFVSAKPIVNLNLQAASIFENQYFSYKNPYLAALEYVPKV